MEEERGVRIVGEGDGVRGRRPNGQKLRSTLHLCCPKEKAYGVAKGGFVESSDQIEQIGITGTSNRTTWRQEFSMIIKSFSSSII